MTTTPTARPVVNSIRHQGQTRPNIPTEELRDFVAEAEEAPATLLYPRDPSLDPQLVWQGKDEQDREDLAVPVVPIYVQERIHPEALVQGLVADAKAAAAGGVIAEEAAAYQIDLFNDFDGFGADFERKVDFYRHDQQWTNRMILGDSLLVMASLAEKEELKGKVQAIYLDPPYGIEFGSNWQVSTRKRDVKDGKAEDLTRQPEQVKAFRDTWALGIHSYLVYLRDRLVVARDLLTESGSLFVQIGIENTHLVRSLLDETFGSSNFCAQILFRKTTGKGSSLLDNTYDLLLWYAKDQSQVKYRSLYFRRNVIGDVNYRFAELRDGSRRSMLAEERSRSDALPVGLRVYRLNPLTSQSASATTFTRSTTFRTGQARAAGRPT